MKKQRFVILFIFFCISTCQLFSQSNVGLKLGYTNAWPKYGNVVLPEDAETNIQGYNFSVSYFKNISNHVALGIEPGFIRRGAACLPGWEPFFTGDSKIFLNYLELPLMLATSYRIGESNLSIFGKGGFGASYMLSAFEEIQSGNDNDDITVNKLDLKNGRMNRLDYGFYSSLGFAYSVSDDYSLIIESNFYYGLRDFEKLNISKNRSFSLSLGFNHRLKKHMTDI